jgi:hypothetical protein
MLLDVGIVLIAYTGIRCYENYQSKKLTDLATPVQNTSEKKTLVEDANTPKSFLMLCLTGCQLKDLTIFQRHNRFNHIRRFV